MEKPKKCMGDQTRHTNLPKSEKRSPFSFGLGYAMKGVFTFFKEGRNAKIHLLAALGVIAAGIYFKLSVSEWLWIILAIALVLITEMLNTSLEILCDLVMPNHHEKAGKLKDIAAGAVLISALFALVVAGLVFWKYLVELF